ncbi:MAG TPA: flavodoxin-dependent (E)-4-hydroxy-3-methylbut-2-enyl-diphosphate synthase [Spirochaetota bacterium]|nr:flavodoxin-dependent (E)-4-hydroxy-3-methylbut-2-enyl-diphosphate synthase [Spirochaetota bacterium]HPI88614.1 flavodoxin-dependent (E)-4-hydroxy-3-methylbut-2-enyl-diphosphate synthase [Spirochaetota bacterium]HPR48255.1 flavodoxin-dependent (E)-4-hydroxy-3-methylbut-2-enyl-diphosphate synthase [Spirochaetota bacterium]
MINRKKTRQVRAGSLLIGGGAPVSIQSMTNIPIEDIEGTIRQINALKEAGADLVRLALRKEEFAAHLKKIIAGVDIPLSADIHFNHRIAIAAIEAGVHKIRINPGNIGDAAKVREVVSAARDRGVPIRIGVNGGSLDKKKYREVTPDNLVRSALEHVVILEDNNFSDIVVSIKATDIFTTIEANRLFSMERDYPLHIGLTEAGYGLACTVQSSIVLGHLLLQGIGDTMRVSMTGDPVNEIPVARSILESLGERFQAIRIISCPTCGRTDPELDILALATEVERRLSSLFRKKLETMGKSVTIAVMGCEVNGPGEASEADLGLAGGRGGKLLLFSRGEKLHTIPQDQAVGALAREVEKLVADGKD